MKKLDYLIMIAMIFSWLNQGRCQNLVPNSSFEELSGCPIKINQLKFCQYWLNPSHAGTPDYFSLCDSLRSVSIVSTPDNYIGNQMPHSGRSYVGILTFFDQYYSCQEYIQTQLTQPLIAGKKYRILAYISLADDSKYFNNQLQFCFSEVGELKSKLIKGYKILYGKNAISYAEATSFRDTANWNLISAVYEATGGEQFLTVGVFKEVISKTRHKKMRVQNIFNPKAETDVAYYYIDDVSVEEIK